MIRKIYPSALIVVSVGLLILTVWLPAAKIGN